MVSNQLSNLNKERKIAKKVFQKAVRILNNEKEIHKCKDLKLGLFSNTGLSRATYQIELWLENLKDEVIKINVTAHKSRRGHSDTLFKGDDYYTLLVHRDGKTKIDISYGLWFSVDFDDMDGSDHPDLSDADLTRFERIDYITYFNNILSFFLV